VRCPATSANLGPGFDALGLALGLFNSFEVSEAPAFTLSASGPGAQRLPTDPDAHLSVVAFQATRRELGLEPVQGLELHVRVEIPPSRGLGSSATATVAGILAAEALAGRELPARARLDLATRLEGHPDNVVPCLLGGLCVAVTHDERVEALRLAPPDPPACVVAIPTEVELSTAEMRAALPKQIPFADASFSSARAALLVGALLTGTHGHLGAALQDRLHQPYRGPHIPGYAELRAAAGTAGAHGLVISGSGPTLLALSPVENADAVREALADTWAGLGVASTCQVLPIDLRGAHLQ
jgi:homoserine kinase